MLDADTQNRPKKRSKHSENNQNKKLINKNFIHSLAAFLLTAPSRILVDISGIDLSDK